MMVTTDQSSPIVETAGEYVYLITKEREDS